MRKLAEDCCKYGAENQSTSTPLVIASDYFGTSYNSIEVEREIFLKILGEQVISSLFLCFISLFYIYKHWTNLRMWPLKIIL